MTRIFTSPPGLPLMLSAVLAGALAPCDGYAQDITHLRTIVDTHSSVILNVMPCLSAKIGEVAEYFSVRTGFSLREFASLASDDHRRLAGEEPGKEQGFAEPVVWRGDYENYSLLSAASIGFAPIAAPDSLRRLGTAYAFPLTDVLAVDRLDRKRLTDQVFNGSVGVAMYDDRSYQFILPGSESWKPMVERVRDPSNSNGSEDRPFFIARPIQFHGVRSTERVIAWDTDQPLNTVLLDAYSDELLESARAVECEDHEIEALRAFLRYAGAPQER